MIKADSFYRCFEAGLAQATAAGGLRRSRGKIPKFTLDVAGDVISLWFKVNGKASAIPYQPGEFWPAIEARTMRHGSRDDGLLSWYQYTDEAMNAGIATLRKTVYEKTKAQTHFEPEFWRTMRDVWLTVSRASLDFELRPGFPHTKLYYLDEADAECWGVLFGHQLGPWLERLRAHPETLEMHMRRVQWGPQAAP